MAKSIRSKWKRKMRAVKRERYGKKELERLKKTLGITDNNSESTSEMVDVSDMVTLKTKDEILQQSAEKSEETNEETETTMEVEVNGRKFSSKTLRDENGSYPIWVHPRKIRKHKKGKQVQKKGKTKKNKGNKKKKWIYICLLM